MDPRHMWLAGAFDADGTVARLQGKRWCAAIGTTDEWVIDRFFEWSGLGKMYGPYGYKDTDKRKRDHHKHYWRWAVSDKAGFTALWEMIGEYLSPRRQAKFLEALEDMKDVKARGLRGPRRTRATLADAEVVYRRRLEAAKTP